MDSSVKGETQVSGFRKRGN